MDKSGAYTSKSLLDVSDKHERLEFKKAENGFDFQKLLAYCVALSNEGGGALVLGVTEKAPREVSGTAAFPNVNEEGMIASAPGHENARKHAKYLRLGQQHEAGFPE